MMPVRAEDRTEWVKNATVTMATCPTSPKSSVALSSVELRSTPETHPSKTNKHNIVICHRVDVELGHHSV